MLNKVMIGSYYPIKSKIHSMNPIAKILCIIIYIIMTFLCNDIYMMLSLLALSILVIELSHVPRKIYFKTLWGIKYLLIFLIAIYGFMGSNIINIIIICLRLYLIVIYTMLLTLTTTSFDITYGLQNVLAPLKLFRIPVNRMVLSISLALRFIPTIIGEGNKIMKSQASRGIDYYTLNLKGKFFAIRSMLVPMFILTLRRSDSLSEAMEVRQYDIDAKRTSLKKHKWNYIDIILLIIHLLLLIFIIVRMI